MTLSLSVFCLSLVSPGSPRTPSFGAKYQHAGQEVAGPSHVAISAISANMDSFARGRTATLKKQPSHIEATHFGDLGTEHTLMFAYGFKKLKIQKYKYEIYRFNAPAC